MQVSASPNDSISGGEEWNPDHSSCLRGRSALWNWHGSEQGETVHGNAILKSRGSGYGDNKLRAFTLTSSTHGPTSEFNRYHLLKMHTANR